MKWLRFSVPVCVVALGCSRETQAPSVTSASNSASAPPAPSAPPAVQLKVASSSAFALAAAPFGASLLWAEPRSSGVALMTLDLNVEGAPERPAWELLAIDAARDVSDLSAAWQGMNRAAVWLEHVADEVRVQALFKTETAGAERLDLGAGYAAPVEARGNVALSVGRDQVMAFIRGPSEPCLAPSEEGCFGFRFHRFGPTREPSRIALTVPVPCEAIAVELLLAEPRWYYGVCTSEGARNLFTLFTIQPDPEYAAARELFSNCVPKGALLVGEHPASIAECNGELRVAWLTSGDEAPLVESLTSRALRCDGNPKLTLGSKVIELSESLAGLELVLPEQLAPAGSLATWTGKAVVVARADTGTLALKRYGCRQGELVDLGAVPAVSASSHSAPR